jgi:hypothetical protein
VEPVAIDLDQLARRWVPIGVAGPGQALVAEAGENDEGHENEDHDQRPAHRGTAQQAHGRLRCLGSVEWMNPG